ncbi:hypothetical protein EXE55_20815 [Burkholderia glumae]|nr:hypothetical protein EXE55_20815 [Burkholderia glumae]
MAAAHHRSPHAAARALGVTQPAITPTIGEVEHALPRAAQQLRATMRDALAQPGNGAPAIAANHPLPALDREFTQMPLLSTGFVIVMRAGHPLEGAQPRRTARRRMGRDGGRRRFPASTMMSSFVSHGLPLPARRLRAPSSPSVTLGHARSRSGRYRART